MRDRYAQEVTAYRQRSSRANTVLVVAIDADTNDVSLRVRQLRDALSQKGLSPRAVGEAIAHLIPKRNIETWIVCLNGRKVDESADYRHEPGMDQQVDDAAGVFHAWTRPNATVPQHCVPSLLSAIPEAKRLE
ncbi:MAG: hypothetical protein ABIZ80_16180 [Bryobacteraceae bacterium]